MSEAPLVITVTNQKGGVGKTFTTFHLTRSAVNAGKRVLVVDMDPQGSLTDLLAAEQVEDNQISLADALSDRTETTLTEVLVDGVWSGIDVAPATTETMPGVRDELVTAGAGRENRLREAVATVAEDYDLVLIDTAPSLDQLTINALVTAHRVVVVTHTKQQALRGLGQLIQTIQRVRSYYNPELTVAGILGNQHEESTVSGQHWLDELRSAAETMSLPLLEPLIPKRVVISDSAEAVHGLDQWPGTEGKNLAKIYDEHLQTLTKGRH